MSFKYQIINIIYHYYTTVSFVIKFLFLHYYILFLIYFPCIYKFSTENIIVALNNQWINGGAKDEL